MSKDFAARRLEARARLDAIDPHMAPGGVAADPLRRGWFEAVYALAGEDAAAVPWANLAPHPLLADWLAREGALEGAVLDVGCGLGDNAEALAKAGARVTAFDLVQGAVDWARKRFPDSSVDYRAADLFDPPAEWRGAFDLVHECYTLQALPEASLAKAGAALASMIAPGGRLLVISRARDDHAAIAGGPPWPLRRASIDALAANGELQLASLEDIAATETRGRHWRAVFSRK